MILSVAVDPLTCLTTETRWDKPSTLPAHLHYILYLLSLLVVETVIAATMNVVTLKQSVQQWWADFLFEGPHTILEGGLRVGYSICVIITVIPL